MAAQTLTFLFTDIEGSTAMLQRLGDGYAQVLADHHRLIRDALAAHDGQEVDTQGDAFFAVFSSARACVSAAITMQQALIAHAWPDGGTVRVRMGIHSGEASGTPAGLVGFDVHRAARIAAAAHGGQIVLSATTAALLRDSLPEGAWLKDLGAHRFKDLGHPEQIFQLVAPGLPVAFPPLRALGNPKPPHNLPGQVSAFIGREAELAEVRRLITAFRLVTLTGSGGVGKTRLGLQAAAGLLDASGDGVWFADLAPLHDPDLVAGTVASVLGIPEDPGRTTVSTLVEAVGERSMLVLLDNCEHVIDACAKLADTLLRDCPNIRLLATSREPLGIEGEHVHRVPSLDTPADGDDVDTIRNAEAVRLFADRADQHGVRAHLGRADRFGGRPHLPAAGRHPPGHRAGRGPAAGHVGDRAGCPARSAVRHPDRRLAHRHAAPADAARHAGLVLGAAARRRAPCARPAFGLRRRVRPGGRRGCRRG